MADMLILQTLFNADKSRNDHPMYDYDGNYKPDVHIVFPIKFYVKICKISGCYVYMSRYAKKIADICKKYA